jgi:hypothetical protein
MKGAVKWSTIIVQILKIKFIGQFYLNPQTTNFCQKKKSTEVGGRKKKRFFFSIDSMNHF